MTPREARLVTQAIVFTALCGGLVAFGAWMTYEAMQPDITRLEGEAARYKSERDDAKSKIDYLRQQAADAVQKQQEAAKRADTLIRSADARIRRLQQMTRTGCEGAAEAIDFFWESRRAE